MGQIGNLNRGVVNILIAKGELSGHFEDNLIYGSKERTDWIVLLNFDKKKIALI